MRSKSLVLSLLVGVLWGGSFVAIDAGLGYFPPLLFAGIRYALVGVVVLGYAVVAARRWYPRSLAELGSVLAAGVFLIAGHHAFLYLGMQSISGAVAAVVVSLSPVLTAVFAAALLSDSDLTSPKVAGLALGLAGVIVISDVGVSAVSDASSIGLVFAFIATASFALGSVAIRPLRTDLPIAAMQGWGMLLGASLLSLTAGVRGESFQAIAWTPPAIVSLAFLVIGPGTIAFLIYFQLLDTIGPMQSNLIAYLEPVVATLLSWALLGEVIDSTTVAGFVAILVGFALVKHRLFGPHVYALVGRLSPRQTSPSESTATFSDSD